MTDQPSGNRPPSPPLDPSEVGGAPVPAYGAPPPQGHAPPAGHAAPYPPPPVAAPYGSAAAAPPAAYDPYAAERALAEWAQARGLALSATPDLRWYQAWQPFVYTAPVARVGRELRGKLDDADLALTEAFDADPIKQAAGEDRQLLCFLITPRLRARAALRAKSGGGLVNDVKSGFGSLFGGASPGSVLGDPAFEQHFDVSVPSREEGNAALPVVLRQLLVTHRWRGILELRAGGLVCAPFGYTQFDPNALDQLLSLLVSIHRAAVS